MKETKFKHTEVGMIPCDWEVKSLGTLADKCSYGVGAEARPYCGGVKYIRITDIDDENHRFSPSPITSPSFYQEKHIVQKNDLLVARTGASVGKTYLYDKKDGTLVYAGFLMKLNVFNADSKYVFYNTLTKSYWNWVASESARTGQPGLNLQQMKLYSIPLPPTIEEQQRIANALSDIDTLIANLEKLIAKKKNIKQGAMQQLLTGKKRLPGFAPAKPTYKQTELGMIPTDWESINLGSIADIRTGKRNGDESETFGKYPFFVRSQTVYRINSYSFDGEAILIPGEGGIGSIFHYINGKFDYHQRVYKISDFSVNFSAKYLFYFMKRYFGPYAMTLTVKATVDSLRLPTFENFVVWYPPSKAEQTAIANVLRDMDTEIDTLEQKLAKVRKIKQGMMQELLTGKIRLV